MRKYGARTLTSNIASKLPRVSSGVGLKSKIPALLTRMSTSPASSASAAIASKSARSAATKRALPPAASISATVSAPRAASRPLIDDLGAEPRQLLRHLAPDPGGPSRHQCLLALEFHRASLRSVFKVDCTIQTGTYVSGLSNPEWALPLVDGTEEQGESAREQEEARRRPRRAPRLTRKGEETRERIVAAAAGLIFERGVAGTSIEDVKDAAGVSSSQLYHYFADKQALVHAVIAHQSDAVIVAQEPLLGKLDSIDALRAWRDQAVAIEIQLQCKGGCPIGTLAGELAEADPDARADIAAGFARWEEQIGLGIAAMHDRGELPADVDPDRLALALLAAHQGGLILTQVRRDPAPIEAALDAMIDHVAELQAAA